MGRLANRLFFLKQERRALSELVHLLDRATVALECGLELSYVWGSSGSGERTALRFNEFLERAAEEHPVKVARPWFAGLADLYREGAPLVPFFHAFSEALHDELRREMENHERELPFRLNIVLLIFCLPPVFVLLFAPLLAALTQASSP